MSTSGNSPKLGLVLGSGASRGWSHIGIINTLLDEGIEPDIVCGASVGAMIGAAYLTGNLDKLEEWVRGSTRTDVLKFFKFKFSQPDFVDVERLDSFLHSYVAPEDVRIEDLKKPFAAVATKLESGQEAWLQDGVLADAVKASMALPGLFPAVFHQNCWLVDGGLVNPVPVTTCRALGADIVIAVNLNSDIVNRRTFKKVELEQSKPEGVLSNLKQTAREYSSTIFANRDKENESPSLLYSLTNAINIVQDRITRSRLAGDPADVVLSPRLAHIGMLEFQSAGEAIAEGKRCVEKSLDAIHAMMG